VNERLVVCESIEKAIDQSYKRQIMKILNKQIKIINLFLVVGKPYTKKKVDISVT